MGRYALLLLLIAPAVAFGVDVDTVLGGLDALAKSQLGELVLGLIAARFADVSIRRFPTRRRRSLVLPLIGFVHVVNLCGQAFERLLIDIEAHLDEATPQRLRESASPAQSAPASPEAK